MAEAESAIKARLETQVSNLSGASAIWAVQAPQDAVRPYLVFNVNDETPVNVMSGETTPTEAQIEVTIYADTFLEVVNITNDVRTAMTRFSGTAGSVTVQDIFYEGRDDFFDEADRTYQRTLDFRMWFEE